MKACEGRYRLVVWPFGGSCKLAWWCNADMQAADVSGVDCGVKLVYRVDDVRILAATPRYLR